MDVIVDNFDLLVDGFQNTLLLLLFGGLIALVLGTILAAMRVSPIGLLRGAGGLYVNVVRNTPLLLILLLFRDAFPDLGFTPEINNEFNFFFIAATLGLGLYTASFVCEVIRSGVNSIPMGQAEAARSLGMTFGQSMTQIVLPQAFRAVAPPMANVYIALAKNTSVAIAIGATEAAFQMRKIMNNNASDRWWVFASFAAGYVLIVWTIALIAHVTEKRWAVSR